MNASSNEYSRLPRGMLEPLFCLALCLAPSAAAGTPQASAIVDHPSQLRVPSLRPFVPPPPVRLTLKSGARLLVIESHELPLVDGTLIFRRQHTPVQSEPAGISALLADALREGGSRHTSGSELDDWLDSHAASIDVVSTPDALRIQFACVKEDLGDVLVFIGELLMIPAYTPEEVERSRARALTRVAHESEDASLLADQSLDSLTLGSSSPLARHATRESLKAITREQLVRHHRRIIGIDRLLVGATGAVDPHELAAHLDSLLAELPAAGPQRANSAQVYQLPGRTTVYLQDRPGAAQCEVRIAGPGLRRLDRDFVPLLLWSRATGRAAAANRMRLKLPTELGLAIEGQLGFEADWSRNGRLLGSFRVRSDAAAGALAAFFEFLNDARKPLEFAELEAARRRMLNAEVFQIDSPEELLQRALELELHGYPADFWVQRDKRLRALTPEEVSGALERHLRADRLTLLVVGPAEELAPALAPLGTLVRLDGQ